MYCNQNVNLPRPSDAAKKFAEPQRTAVLTARVGKVQYVSFFGVRFWPRCMTGDNSVFEKWAQHTATDRQRENVHSVLQQVAHEAPQHLVAPRTSATGAKSVPLVDASSEPCTYEHRWQFASKATRSFDLICLRMPTEWLESITNLLHANRTTTYVPPLHGVTSCPTS